MTKNEQERKHHVLISNWIKEWTKENPYKEDNLTDHNSKFKSDFNMYLNSNDFPDKVKDLYLN